MPVFAGRLLMPDGVIEGYVEIEGGRIVSWGEGESEGKPDARGWIIPAPVNAHTHVGDAALRDHPGKPRNLAELVGPGGWKARESAQVTPAAAASATQSHVQQMAAIGTATFIDFREGGVAGAKWLADLAADLRVEPFIMGRPSQNDFDADEASLLLAACDGVGLSAARDFDRFQDVAQWAEACHKARKPFALHVSEARHEPLDRILALEPDFLVHACHATKAEMRALADEEVPVVVCPRSNAWFGIRTPIQAMLDAGLELAVGTDNAMLQDGDLLAELGAARTLAPKTSDESLLRMATAGRRLAGLAQALPPRRGAELDLVVYPERFIPAGRNLKPGFVVPDAA